MEHFNVAFVASQAHARRSSFIDSMTQEIIRTVLSIAGSDPSCGAGFQADIKTISACGCYALGAPTALTVQNTRVVRDLYCIEPDFLAAQIDALFSDIRVDAVKIGMTGSCAAIAVIADRLTHWKAKNVVLDPVMAASSGDPLAREELAQAMQALLFPVIDLVTPNLGEAARLAHIDEPHSDAAMRCAARRLRLLGAKAVLVKGGHRDAPQAVDYFSGPGGDRLFTAPRIAALNTHGTGCALSAAIASHLARGASLEDAIDQAKAYVTQALAQADRWKIGEGAGPLAHFHNFKPL